MKKTLIIFSIIAAFDHCIGQETKREITENSIITAQQESKRTSSANNILWKIAKDYFRSNPFDREFSEFLSHLMNDPTLVNKTIHKRTDTTFFYLRGEYSTHKPFFFIPKRVEVIVAESEEQLIDSLPNMDTVITYQLAGYSNGDASGEADVKEEFEKFDRKYKKKFPGSNYTELKNGNTIYGAIHNYFIVGEGLAPLEIAWQKIGSTSEYVFVITFRFEVNDNIPVLAMPANSP